MLEKHSRWACVRNFVVFFLHSHAIGNSLLLLLLLHSTIIYFPITLLHVKENSILCVWTMPKAHLIIFRIKLWYYENMRPRYRYCQHFFYRSYVHWRSHYCHQIVNYWSAMLLEINLESERLCVDGVEWDWQLDLDFVCYLRLHTNNTYNYIHTEWHSL